jgi:hypothetical protein
MGKARALVNKLKRRRKSANQNRGFRRQDKIDRKDEVLADSPSAYKYIRGIQRRQDAAFGQQLQPTRDDKPGKEMLVLADLQPLDNTVDNDIPAVAAFFEGQVAGMTEDVRIEADNAGAAGNSILLAFDGLDDIDTVLLAWNTANPGNTATLASGDGSQVPDNLEEIQLANGADAIAIDDAVEFTLASGMARAVGVQPGDVVMVLAGELKGQQLTVTAVDLNSDTFETELVGELSGSENDVAIKIQISGTKKSFA